MSLSIDERQKLNYTLQQLTDTRKLIMLETQKDVPDNLQEKAASFKSMVISMGAQSARLANLAKYIDQLVRPYTTNYNALTDAFSGIIKPKSGAIFNK